MEEEKILNGIRYVAVDQASKEFGRTRDYLMTLCRLGKVDAKRFGRIWYVSHPSLVAFVDDQRQALEKHYQKLAEERSREYGGRRTEAVPVRVPGKGVSAPADSSPKIGMGAIATWTRLVASAFVIVAVVSLLGVQTFPVQGSSQAAGVFSGVSPFIERVINFFRGSQGEQYVRHVPDGATEQVITNNTYNTTNNNYTTNNNTFNESYETVVQGISEDLVEGKVSALGNQLRNEFARTTFIGGPPASGGLGNTVAISQRIDNLSGVTIANGSWTGGRISNADISAASLVVSGAVDFESLTLTNALAVSSGGTGVSNAPVFGQLLVGNAAGGYDLVATSSLGIVGGGGGTPGGSDGEIQFNDNGAFGSNSSFTFSTSTQQFSVTNSSTTNSTTTILFAERASTTHATSTTLFAVLGRFTSAIIETLSATFATIANLTSTNLIATNASTTQFSNVGAAFFGGTATSSFDSAGVLTLAAPLATSSGGTGISSYSAGDILYVNGAGTLSRLAAGSPGQVLKISAGIPGWGADITGSGGGGAGLFATSSDNLLIYPTDTSYIVTLGASATTTTGNILEVAGSALFRNALTAYGTLTAPRFVSTSTFASIFPYASSTAFTATTGYFGAASTSNLTISTIQNGLLATNGSGGVVATTSISSGLVAGSLGTINGTILNRGDSITVSAASSTLLGDNNSFSGLNVFSNASTTLLSGTTAWFTNFIGNLVGNVTGNLTGNASTATALQNARTINGTSFDGTSNITITAASSTLLTDNNTFSGNTTLTNATSTNFFGTTANFGSLAASLIQFTTLNVSGLSTLASGFVSQASSTVVGNFTTTGVASSTNLSVSGTATTTNLAFTNLASAVLSTNALGQVVATTSISSSLITGSLGTVNGTAFNRGDSITVSAASSTLLTDNNTFSGRNTIAFASTTALTVSGTGYFALASSTQFLAGVGSVSSASYGFSGAANTGITYSIFGNIEIHHQGAQKIQIGATDIGIFSALNSYSSRGFYIKRTAGTAAAPTYSFLLDEDTGVFSASADTLSLSTGGIERATVGSSGNFGIGTSTPWAKLAISANSGETNIRLFDISSSTASATSSLFTVLNTGNVGIGTTTPQQTLSVAGSIGVAHPTIDFGQVLFTPISATTSVIRYEGRDAYVAGGTAGFQFGLIPLGNPGDANRWAEITDNGAYFMSGNVGIGTTTPPQKLAIQGASPLLQFYDSGTNRAAGIGMGDGYNLTLSSPSVGWNIYKSGVHAFQSADGSTEYMRISGSNVGIGTTTPQRTLDVFSATGNGSLFVGSLSGQAQLGVYDKRASSVGSYLYSATGYSGIATLDNTGAFSGTPINWTTTNVGVGTTSPQNRLHLHENSGGAVNIQFTNNDSGSGSATAGFRVGLGSTEEAFIVQGGDNDLSLWTNSLRRMTIKNDGNVGIGTTTPTTPLHVVTTSSTASLNLLTLSRNINGTNTETGIAFRDRNVFGSEGQLAGRIYTIKDGTNGRFDMRFGTAPDASTDATDKLTIRYDGNVGIGTTTPDRRLHVNGGSVMSALGTGGTFKVSSTANSGGVLEMGIHTGTGALAIQSNTQGTNVARNLLLQPFGGNLGIGTTTPEFRLDIEHNQNSASAMRLVNTSTGANGRADLRLSDGVHTGYLFFNGSGNSNFGGANSLNLFNSANAPITFFTNGNNERVRITGSGNVGIGTLDPSYRLVVSNNGAEGLEISPETVAGTVFHQYYNRSTSAYITSRHIAADYRFEIAGTERFRINGGGGAIVGAGTFTGGGANIELNAAGYINTSRNTTAGAAQMQFYNPNGVVGSIVTSGSATAFNTSSDRRLKENIATTSMGLEQLMQLPVRDFRFKTDEVGAGTTGFIAQELYEVFPWAVVTNGDNGIDPLSGTSSPWAVDYGRITPLLAKSIQDLNLKVESLASSTLSQQHGGFVESVFAALKTRLTTWLADAGNGIAKFFAQEVRTEMLCIGETCVSEEQLKALLARAAASSGGAEGESSDGNEDMTAPVITVLGANPATVNVGDTYSDLGATVSDEGSPNIGIEARVDDGKWGELSAISIDTASAGTYTVEYRAVDQEGNVGTAERTVNVIDESASSETPAAEEPLTESVE